MRKSWVWIIFIIILSFFFKGVAYAFLEKGWEGGVVDYYCEEGIKFYEQTEYGKAKEAFKKALLIDEDCEIARRYLVKIEKIERQMEEREKKRKVRREKKRKVEQRKGEEKIEKQIEQTESLLSPFPGKEKESIYEFTQPAHYFQVEDISRKQKEAVDLLNKAIYPVRISGEYRIGLGVYSDGEVEWKKADADWQENNWRYLYGDLRFNTFDPVIYNRLKVNVDAALSGNWSFGMEIVNDPWSFIGRTPEFRIYNADKSDYADIQLKYWGNLETTIPQTVRTHKGNVIDIPEIKVEGGKIVPTSLSASWSDELGKGWTDSFGTISDYEFSSEYRPVRSLWVEYKGDAWKMKVFPFGGQEEALSSDDPLGLSNHHIYWEPSPWLDYWEQGQEYTATGWESGEWKKDWYTEDSEHQWLRRLRGVSFAFGDPEYGDFSLESTIATPLDVWEDYSELNALPMALRARYRLSEEWQIGTTQTGRVGYVEGSRDAYAWAGGLDIQYSPYSFENTVLSAEIARSKRKENILSSVHEQEKEDDAYKLKLTTKIPTLFPAYYYEDIPLDIDFSYTRLGEDFYAPLASYTYTRDDQAWGRYLSFFPRSPQDEAVRLGDSVDIDREVYGLTLRSRFFEGRIRPLFNYRNAHRVSDDEFIEAIYRSEIEYDILDNLQSKIVYIYEDKPEDSEGRDLSVDRTAFGLRYEWTDWLTTEAIYTYTNEYPSFPDDLYSWVSANPEPPYPHYNIYKARVIYQPFSQITLTFDHTTNEFKFANRIADDYYYDELTYDGLEIEYKPNSKLSTRFVYRYSYVANLNQYIDNGEEEVEGHHNLYAEIIYHIDPDATLSLQYGDLGVYSEPEYIPYSHAVLDTQHLVRIFYTQKF